jgi:hypothetical protein
VFAETFIKVMGRPIRFNKLPMLIVRLFLGMELHKMFRWINRVGYDVDIPALRINIPAVKLTSLEEWLLRDGWGKKNTK